MPGISSDTNVVSVAVEQTTQAQGVTTESPAVIEGVVDAGSPTANEEGVKQPASALDAVKDALKVTRERGGSEEGEGAKRESPNREADSKDGKTEGSDDISDEELSKQLSEKANRRFRQLHSERDAFRQEAEQYKAGAEAFKSVVEKVQATGASSEQIDQAIALLHALNNDPARAFQMVAPLYNSLSEFVGAKLPADLQERVDGGFLDEAAAAELARLRNTSKFTENRNQRETLASQERSSQERFEETRNAVGEATSKWEADWKRSDPDYQQKHPFVMSEIRAAIAERGGVSSPQEALEIAQSSLKAVNDRLGVIVPQRRDVKTVTGGFSSGKEVAAPRSALEAAKNALRS